MYSEYFCVVSILCLYFTLVINNREDIFFLFYQLIKQKFCFIVHFDKIYSIQFPLILFYFYFYCVRSTSFCFITLHSTVLKRHSTLFFIQLHLCITTHIPVFNLCSTIKCKNRVMNQFKLQFKNFYKIMSSNFSFFSFRLWGLD